MDMATDFELDVDTAQVHLTRVNLETDVIAKHVAKLVAAYLPTAAGEQHSKEQQA